MELGNSVFKSFVCILGLGALALFLTLGICMFDDSPCRYGRPGMAWMLVQMASSVMLIYAGMFGLMTCNVTEVTAGNYNMKVAWGAFIVVALLLGSTLWFALGFPHTITQPGDWTDDAVMWIGSLSAIVSLFAYLQACRYFLRLHRLRRPYEELLG